MVKGLYRNPNQDFWKNKKVLITGHNGFKGSWLSLWLLNLGVDIYGISLDTPDDLNLFDKLKISKQIQDFTCDVTDSYHFEKLIVEIKPDIIFHMAAQPLVKESYLKPKRTWEVNIIGTINLLESLRKIENKCLAIIVTTDKVYKNDNLGYAFREEDPLGGYDPYSSSKAGCELAVEAWRKSFCGENTLQKQNLFLSTVRAGNIIGGGDWSEDRIIPDLVRSIRSSKNLKIRNPKSVRPWQHVLDPLCGYILLAENFVKTKWDNNLNCLNFGPLIDSNQTVENLVHEAFGVWHGSWEKTSSENQLYESTDLRLAIDKAYKTLGWHPRLDFKSSVEMTIEWYKSFYENPDNARRYCENDINKFLF